MVGPAAAVESVGLQDAEHIGSGEKMATFHTADLAVVEAMNRVLSTRMRVIGRAEEGTSGGAIFVELGDGAPGVVTTFLGTRERAEQTARFVNYAHASGLAVPPHLHVVEMGTSVYLVQARLEGEPPKTVTPAVIDAVVEVNDSFADLLLGHPEVPPLPLCLRDSGDPYPRHEVLAAHSARSRAILNAIQTIGREQSGEGAGNDLHHVDLDLSNVLLDEAGSVVGVVDWNLGVFRGDRHQALVKTRFEQEWALHAPAPESMQVAAAAHLDDILEHRVAATDLSRYWASRMLYQLHWILQYGRPEHVDWHLAVAEERLL